MDLNHRQQKIQEKRKQTSWRDFVMEIGAWKPLVFYKINGKLSVYAPHERVAHITDPEEFENMRDVLPSVADVGDFQTSFQQLRKSISLPGRLHFGGLENAAYTTTSVHSKNNYLAYNTSNVQDIAYTVSAKAESVNVFNSIMVYDHCDTVYYSYAVFNGYHIFYSRYIHNARDIWFCANLTNCQECLFCSGLENTSYCIFNKQYEKETYFEKKQALLKQKENYMKWFAQVDREGIHMGSDACSGSCIITSTEVTNAYSIYNIMNGRNVYMSGEEMDNQYMYDAFFVGALGDNHYYGVVDIAGSEHIYCSTLILGSSQIYYSYFLQDCSFCFGCIGLKNKSFCIFNKQYEKQEWYDRVDHLFASMEKACVLGKFLSAFWCPYYFNDTVAYQIDDSFTKEEVEAAGYLRRDAPIHVDIPEGMEVVKVSDLGQYEGRRHHKLDAGSPGKLGDTRLESNTMNAKWWIDPEIMRKVIQDDQGNVYKVIKMEYDFLMKHGLPVPRLHWLDRLKMNFKIV